jgi:hypothetical protein
MNWANKLAVHYSMLEMLVRGTHFSLLDKFISYKENEVL